MKVAHVGAFKRFSNDDSGRWVCATEALNEFDPAFLFVRNWQHDSINLLNGRDFLTEEGQYDIVVLHALPKHSATGLGATIPIKLRPQLLTSELHYNGLRWDERLVGTGATHVFSFHERNACMWLHSIPGYSAVPHSDSRFEWFTKQRKE